MLGIDDNNNLTTRNSRAIDAATISHMAPPVYGHHQLDQLYSDVDFSGFQTPAGLASEVGTPFGARSRAASVDNLTSINETASSEVAANTLRNRLDNLNTTEDSRAIRAQAAATAPPNDTDSLLRPDASRQSSGHSLAQQRSDEDNSLPSGAQTPMQPSMSHIEYSAGDLTRVPSYATALQARSNVPIDNSLPNYQAAVSAPNSSPSNQTNLTLRSQSATGSG